jgi:hypothetical protein
MIRDGSGLPRDSGVRKSSGWRVELAPGESKMRFSPEEDSTRITATPVDWLGISFMPETSMPSFSMFWMIPGPKASSPTAPTILTLILEVVDGEDEEVEGFGRERRAQATALQRMKKLVMIT